MNRYKKPLIVLSFFFFSCGIEEYYYLPQVPENRITPTSTTSARIELPPIDHISYARNYSIFYRIYISDFNTTATINTHELRSSVSSELARDFITLSYYTDTTGFSFITTERTFRDAKYYEIDLEGKAIADIFSKYGGVVEILFGNTGDMPTVTFGINEARLRRNKNLTSPQPDNRYFKNTPDLNNNANATTFVNADVAPVGTGSNTYVSMYIVAVGYNNEKFSLIYSKPTHINIFRLPD
jgi:hypothetical protein